MEIDGQKIKKTYGLIVDYAGIGGYLTQALEMFDNQDISEEEVIKSQDKDVSVLKNKLEDIIDYLDIHNLDDNSNLEDFLEFFENEKERNKFKEKVKTFNETLDELLPNNDLITEYGKYIKLFNLLAYSIKERFRETTDDTIIDEAGAKVKKLIDDYVRTMGVKVVVDEVDILDIDFKNRLKLIGTDKGQALEMREQLKTLITQRIGSENPVLFKTLSEKLNKILSAVKNGIMDIKQELEEYYKIRDEIIKAENEKKDNNMGAGLYALFTFFKNIEVFDIDFVRTMWDELKGLCVSDWIYKDNAIKDIQKYLKRKLYDLGYDEKELRDRKINEILEILQLNYGK